MPRHNIATGILWQPYSILTSTHFVLPELILQLPTGVGSTDSQRQTYHYHVRWVFAMGQHTMTTAKITITLI